MGYCTYGDKLVPGNTQASCIGGGGNWVGGETGPDTQISMPPIGSPIQLPNIGRPPIQPEPDRGIPGYQAPQITQSPQRMWDNTDDFGNRLDTDQFGNSNFGLLRDRAVNKQNTNAINGTGMFNSSNRKPGQLSAADIPGHGPMNVPGTAPKASGIFDVSSAKDLQYPTGPTTPIRDAAAKVSAPFVRPFVEGSETANPILISEAKNIMEKPIQTALEYYTGLKLLKGLNWASKPLKNKFIKTYVTRNKKWQAPIKGKDGKIITGGKEVEKLGLNYGNAAKTVLGGSVVAADLMSDDSEIKGGIDTVRNKMTPSQQAQMDNTASSVSNAAGSAIDATTGFFADRWNLGNRDNTSVDTATTPNIFLDPAGTDKKVEEVAKVTPEEAAVNEKTAEEISKNTKGTNTADVADVLNGQKSLFGDMQKPGYWSEKVEGGSGSWDNRLFRLGEMMSYMGTPLSKRGDNPSKRWTTASATAATAAAKANKTSNNIGKLGYGAIGDAVIAELKDTPMFSPFGVDMFSKYDEEELAGMQGSAQVKVNALMTKYPAMTVEQAAKQAVDELKLGI